MGSAHRRAARRAVLFLAVLGAAVSPGCRSLQVSRSMAQAREALLAVRPRAEVSQARAQLLTSPDDLRRLAAREDASALNLEQRRKAFEEHTEALLRLRLLEEGDLEPLRRELVELSVTNAVGLAIPSKDLIFIEPGASLETYVHELAHLASAHRGYAADAERRIYPRPGGRADPDWIDLDAMVASRLLSEGEATFSARAALARLEGGEEGIARLWREPIAVDRPHGTGPVRVSDRDGKVILDVGPGEPVFLAESTLGAMSHLAYGGSMALIQARHREGEGLEETLERVWKGFSYATREVLFPAGPAAPSRYAAEMKTIVGGSPQGGSRAGAFLVWEMLKRWPQLKREKATEIVGTLEDDLVLRFEGKGLLWVTRWESPAAAARFADIYRKILKEGTVEVDGVRVAASLGEIPRRAEVLSLLR